MQVARVIGTVTATVKESRLAAYPLLLVQFEDGSGEPAGTPIVAADMLGAGAGQKVLVTTGSASRVPPALQGIPADAAIVGIIDTVTVNDPD